MIKFRRGSTQSWRGTKIKLEPGQPGYDKNKHKIKIGDGENLWSDLPYATGLFTEEILDSETNAKSRKNNDAEDLTLITYGNTEPNKDTVGQIYLQQTDEPEVDYVIESGVNGIWSYQKWKHGFAKCWCRVELTTDIQTAFEDIGLYQDNNSMRSMSYPIKFIETPAETATLQSPGSVVWLSGRTTNTNQTAGTYALISPYSLYSSRYFISLQVEGFWK
jgi:hypothetical protein